MKPRITMRRALTDDGLLGKALGGDSWRAWRVLLIAAMGEALEAAELATFTALTGRSEPPPGRVEELFCVVGRRGGKSRAMAALAVYLAALVDWRDRLVAGETGVLLAIAPDTKQSAVLLGYCSGMMQESPMLAERVVGQTADSISLRGGVSIECRAASFKRLRGVTCIGLVADEAAFWASDGANPDSEILSAIRPTLASTSGPIAVISSPYSRKGEVFEAYRRHYGRKGDPLILVAQAATRTLNPTLPESVVKRALERDPIAARAEYLAEFRSDLEQFISIEAVAAATAKGVIERAPVRDVTYHAGIDPSGGVRDSMVLAISHVEKIDDREVATLDMIREVRAPFVPADVVAQFAIELRRYGCRTAEADRYAASWPMEEFRRHGIVLKPTRDDRSGLYLELIGPLNSGLVALLDNPRLASQLTGLERRTGRSGKDMIDHGTAAGSADDVANASAIALGMALRKPKRERMGIGGLKVGERRYDPMPGRNLFM